MNKKALIIGGSAVAVTAVAVVIIVVATSDGGSDEMTGNTKNTGANIDDNDIIKSGGGDGGGGDTDSGNMMPSSDPEKVTTAFTLLAIGDWGTTLNKEGGSCCGKTKDKNTQRYKTDYHSQLNIATLLSQSAGELSPEAILGHGDSVYWNGLGPKDATSRMTMTFDNVYNQQSLKGIPWFNVAGNHDIGGSMYLCGPADNQFVPCQSSKELVDALEAKFTLMANYKSPDNDRWKMPKHYYKETVEKNGVSVDIFNIDTNWADVHGASQVCCQCFGYSKGSDAGCDEIVPGNPFCAGGDTGMYNACMDRIKEWWNDSINSLEADLESTTADWKVINTHYSPHFHMDLGKAKVLFKICSKFNVQVYMNGHTHGFNHDISKFNTHFFENGGGGGIKVKASGQRPEVFAKFIDTQWIASDDPYGFFEMSFSKDWLKMQFVTFDNAWTFDVDIESVKKGGISRKSGCWHIPRTGSPGKECESSTGIGNIVATK